jgi:hypothetical protein
MSTPTKLRSSEIKKLGTVRERVLMPYNRAPPHTLTNSGSNIAQPLAGERLLVTDTEHQLGVGQVVGLDLDPAPADPRV